MGNSKRFLSKSTKCTPCGICVYRLEQECEWSASFKKHTQKTRCLLLGGVYDCLCEFCFRMDDMHAVDLINEICPDIADLSSSLIRAGFAHYVNPNGSKVEAVSKWIRFDFEIAKNDKKSQSVDNSRCCNTSSSKDNEALSAPPLKEKKENKPKKDYSSNLSLDKNKSGSVSPPVVEASEKSAPLTNITKEKTAAEALDNSVSVRLFEDCLEDKKESVSEQNLTQEEKRYLNQMYPHMCRLLGLPNAGLADKTEGIRYIMRFPAEYRVGITEYAQVVPYANGISQFISKLTDESIKRQKVAQAQ